MDSSIYTGFTYHRRTAVRDQSFKFKVFMPLLYLDEIDRVFQMSRLLSFNKSNLVSLKRTDHYGDPQLSFNEMAQGYFNGLNLKSPVTRIALLCNWRYFGHCINPISVYYGFCDAGVLRGILAEVQNTPWGERCIYPLRLDSVNGQLLASTDKLMHVSPFLKMHYRYLFEFNEPDDLLSMKIKNLNLETDSVDFYATLTLRRREMTASEWHKMLIKFPCHTLKVFGGIYWRALYNLCRRVPFVTKPEMIHAEVETEKLRKKRKRK